MAETPSQLNKRDSDIEVQAMAVAQMMDKGANGAEKEAWLLKDVVIANPAAAKETVAQLQRDAQIEKSNKIDQAMLQGANLLNQYIKETAQLSEEDRRKITIANLEEKAGDVTISTKLNIANKDYRSMFMEANDRDALKLLVEANPEAAREAIHDLQSKKGEKDSIDAIRTAMKAAGVSETNVVESNPSPASHTAANNLATTDLPFKR